MPSPFNDLTLSLDATHLHEAGDGQSRSCGDAHQGRPVDLIATWLKTLPRRKWRFLNRVRLIVGHPWSWVGVLPWQEGLYRDAAWEGYARASLGAPLRRGRWSVRVEDAGHGQPRLAVAVDAALLDAVDAVCKAAGWRLVETRDALTPCLDHQTDLQKSSDGCLLLAQRRVVTCVFRERGAWRDVVTLARARDDAESWLTTAALMAGRPVPTRVHVGGLDLPALGAGMRALQAPDARADVPRLRLAPGGSQ